MREMCHGMWYKSHHRRELEQIYMLSTTVAYYSYRAFPCEHTRRKGL